MCPCLPVAVRPMQMLANDKPKTFTRILLNVTKDKFEEVVKQIAAPSQSEAMTERVFCQLIPLVSFIGHLYVRRLVAMRVIAQVVHDLVGVRDIQPHENLIFCVTELMYIVGRTMDASVQGSTLMDQFLQRLENYAATRASAGTDEAFYPQDVRASAGSTNGRPELARRRCWSSTSSHVWRKSSNYGMSYMREKSCRPTR